MALTHFSYRSLRELAIWSGYPEFKPVEFERPKTSVRTFQYSKDGRRYAFVTTDGVKVLDTATQNVLCTINKSTVIEIDFSPKGSYLCTWERPTKLEDGSGSNNLIIWDASTGTELASFSQKNSNNWNIQFTEDERYCARMVTGEIHFWESKNVGKAIWAKLKLEGVTQFSLSPGKSPNVAAFIPEKKGAPAIVKLFGIPNFNAVLSQKTFYRADKVQFIWNTLGTNVLILTSTDVDKTGKSYYGETNLYYLAVAGNFDCRVALDKEGPIHDVAWSPASKEFTVVYGSMPSKTMLFDHRANPVHDFGTTPRNFVRYNPQGHIICVAGFGNLNGSVDFWDRRTCKKITTIQASNASHCEWSPCGRFLMTATLTPRLRVDNGFKLWHYTGTMVYHEAIEELYQIAWQPAPTEQYPMRNTLSPAPKVIKAERIKEGRNGASTPDGASKPIGAYRPPHLRGTATPTIFKREDETATQNGKTYSAPKPVSTVPGAAPPQPELSKAALKNKKKREAAKKKKDEDSGSEPASGVTTPIPASPKISTNMDAIPTSQLSEADKKMRNLQKKLRQIQDLKERQAKGETLELTQVQKIKGEAALVQQIETMKLQ